MKINIQLISSVNESLTELGTQFKFEAKSGQYLYDQSYKTLYIGTRYESNPIEINDFDKTLYYNLGLKAINNCPDIVSEILIKNSQLNQKDLENFIFGIKSSLFSYSFRDKVKLKDIKINSEQEVDLDRINSISDGIYFTKHVTDLNPNELNPTTYIQILNKEFENSNKPWIKVRTIKNQELVELGMNMLTSVGRGSEHGANLYIIEIEPVVSPTSTTVFIGKGLTFDTGGVNIKENGNSFGMQDDMAGSATIFGVVKALQNLPQPYDNKLVFLSGIVENVTDGRSFMPGEILENIAGQTSIVKNTDAEGRLTLSDVVAYSVINYKPDQIITIATLTGAAISSFTGFSAPIFSNNKEFRNKIYNYFLKAEEECIQVDMPSRVFRDGIKDITGRSDMSNTGSYASKGAGSQTAAAFVIASGQPKLYKKYNEELPDSIPVVHIDIAGTSVDSKGNGTAYGVRSLVEFLTKN